MNRLPDHTTRYFASQDYRLHAQTGIRGPWCHKTVQGVELWVEYDRDRHEMHCSYEIDGERHNKIYKVAKSWAY